MVIFNITRMIRGYRPLVLPIAAVLVIGQFWLYSQRRSGVEKNSSSSSSSFDRPNVGAGGEERYDFAPGVVHDCITWHVEGIVDLLSFNATTFSMSDTSHRQRRRSFWGALVDAVWNGGDGRKTRPPFVDSSNDTVRLLHSIVDHIKKKLKVKRVVLLDAPCGDVAWMSDFLSARKDVDYTCYDGRPEVIAANRNRFASAHPEWRFEERHVIAAAADGVLLRDDTFHLVVSRQMSTYFDNVDLAKFLNIVSSFGSSFLLTTTYANLTRNAVTYDGAAESFKPMNLEAPPLSLVPPSCYADDNDGGFLSLWRLPLERLSDCREAVRSSLLVDVGTYYACAPTVT